MVLKLAYDILVGAPLTLCKQVLEGIRQEIDKERLITEDSIKQRLQQLQLLLQDSEITEEEYQEMEDKLIERLRAVREYQREVS
ncbi:MAG: gas vesicle protein GvpG [Chloroflexi bacterium]|nr:gas vesicle protein GvpG [Chloroflexota bacterium]